MKTKSYSYYFFTVSFLYSLLLSLVFFQCADKVTPETDLPAIPAATKQKIQQLAAEFIATDYRYGYADADPGAVVQSEPKPGGQKLITIPQGYYFKIVKASRPRSKNEDYQTRWFLIQYNGAEGFLPGTSFQPSHIFAEITKTLPQVKSKVFSGAATCDGITYSEYAVSLNFSEVNVEYKFHGEGTDKECLPRNAGEPPLHGSGASEIIKSGSYTVMKDHIIIEFNKKIEKNILPEHCKNAGITTQEKKIKEKIKLVPAKCHSDSVTQDGLIAVGNQEDGNHVWVPVK